MRNKNEARLQVSCVRYYPIQHPNNDSNGIPLTIQRAANKIDVRTITFDTHTHIQHTPASHFSIRYSPIDIGYFQI